MSKKKETIFDYDVTKEELEQLIPFQIENRDKTTYLKNFDNNKKIYHLFQLMEMRGNDKLADKYANLLDLPFIGLMDYCH